MAVVRKWANGGGVGAPQVGAGEYVAGLEVQVESGAVYLAPDLVAEVDACVGLVWGSPCSVVVR